MIWLSQSTLERLRDQLRRRGERSSVALPSGDMSDDTLELVRVVGEYGPLCEAMYLMMSADSSVSDAEREVLRGALRNLSGDAVRAAHIETMLSQASKAVEEHGRDRRLEAVAEDLRHDVDRAEVAFVLAAAIAFADSAIADEENETLNRLAERLGIREDRANALLDAVESDLSAGRSAGGN